MYLFPIILVVNVKENQLTKIVYDLVEQMIKAADFRFVEINEPKRILILVEFLIQNKLLVVQCLNIKI